MLPFEEQVLSDLLDDPNGGLVVVSSGLPLAPLLAALLRLHHPSRGAFLILSAAEALKSHLRDFAHLAAVQDVPPDLTAAGRVALYSSGAALFISPRALVADLLTARLSPSTVAAVAFLAAHRISDTSPESFVARLLRSGPAAATRAGQPVPVYAFSDRPHAMTSGFAKAERAMKCLFIRRLHLWPRFHVLVAGDLERAPPDVIDIRVPMSSFMQGIQSAVLDAMGVCLKELRRTNKVDVEDLTVEKGLFKSFDEIVRCQLDPIWHTLGRKTKQLVADLKTLRKLLDYLVRYDAVTYLKYLDTLRASEGVRSVWIFADSTHKIFELSKKRVYQLVRADGTKFHTSKGTASKKRKKGKEIENEVPSTGGPGLVLEEVLEEAPKWKVLRELLEEMQEHKENTELDVDSAVQDGCDSTDIVLVACKDERSCIQLEECILKDPQKVMRDEWEKYLLGKAELLGLRKQKKKKSQGPKGFGVLDGIALSGSGSSENPEALGINKLENDALLAAASEISNFDKEDIDVENNRKEGPRRRLVGTTKGRGKVAKGKRTKQPGRQKSVSSCENATDTKANSETDIPSSNADETREYHPAFEGEECSKAKPLPPVQFYAIDSDRNMLGLWKPSVIIVYHPDVAFVRQIEVYKAENPLRKLKVYFLFYDDSTEVQKFEASIRRETTAFESLIRQKSLMMIPVDQKGICRGPNVSNEAHLVIPQNSSTRKAGGRLLPEKEMQVVVDMREFMSSLPNVLHQKGMRIIPITLEVGDYVLSPLICVERKSVGDLFQSFASGRLFNQVEMMVRYYKIPVLLIEFSQDKSFSFQSANDIGEDVSPTNIISKLSLLVLHFPRLRIIWSRSFHATADIFVSLKANQDEPDESTALRVGVPTDDKSGNEARAESYDTSAVEFLRRLPGITDANYRAIMDGCGSLAELALLPVERLAELMGPKGARMLREFLDAKCPTLL